MQHTINYIYCIYTIIRIPDIARKQGKGSFRQKGFNNLSMPNHKVIEAHHFIILQQQRFAQVAADKLSPPVSNKREFSIY
jgi:hypothetical protein